MPVWELRGVLIGSVLSAPAVSVHLGAAELRFERSSEAYAALLLDGFLLPPDFTQWHRIIGWLRYVDDLLGMSRVYCGTCLQRFSSTAIKNNCPRCFKPMGMKKNKPHRVHLTGYISSLLLCCSW